MSVCADDIDGIQPVVNNDKKFPAVRIVRRNFWRKDITAGLRDAALVERLERSVPEPNTLKNQ